MWTHVGHSFCVFYSMDIVHFTSSLDGPLPSPVPVLFSLNYGEEGRWEKRSHFPCRMDKLLSEHEAGLTKGPEMLFSLGEGC